MKGKFFSIIALLFAIGVFVWFYFRPPSMQIPYLPDRLSASLAANSLTELESFIQTQPKRHQSHLSHLKNQYSSFQKCFFWQKDCQRQALIQAFISLKDWSEDFRAEIEVQTKVAPAIYIISQIAHHYQIDEPSLKNYAKEFSSSLLQAYPENLAVIRQAVFIQSQMQALNPALQDLLSKCLALDSIKGYCQAVSIDLTSQKK